MVVCEHGIHGVRSTRCIHRTLRHLAMGKGCHLWRSPTRSGWSNGSRFMARGIGVARLTFVLNFRKTQKHAENFFNFFKTRFAKHHRVFFFWNLRSCFVTRVGNYFKIYFVAVAIHARVFFFEIGSIRPFSDFQIRRFFELW